MPSTPSIRSVDSNSSRYSGNWFRKKVLDPVDPFSPPSQKDFDSWQSFAKDKVFEYQKNIDRATLPGPQEPKDSSVSKEWKDLKNGQKAWSRGFFRINTIKSFITHLKK
jgi:hypothetical protein